MNVNLVISLACNLRCSFCYQDEFGPHIRLSDGILYDNLLPALKSASEIHLQGGELTIMPGMPEYIRFVRSVNPAAPIYVVTNGIEFDHEWTELAHDCDITVTVSLNAATPETYAKIAGVPGGERLWEKALVNVRRLSSGKLRQLPSISMVVVDETAPEILAFEALSRDLGLGVKFIYDCTGKRLSEKVLATLAVVEELAASNRKVHVTNRPFSDERQPPATVCQRPWSGLALNPWGQVMFCERLTNYVIGDLNEERLDEVLWGTRAEEFRNTLLLGDYQYCRQDCPLNPHPETHKASAAKAFRSAAAALLERGDYANALPMYRRRVANLPGEAAAAYGLAYCLHMIGHHEEAVRMYDRALDLRFDEFWVRYNRGSLLYMMGDISAALEDISAAIGISPDHEGAKQVMGQLKSTRDDGKVKCESET